MPGSLRGEAVIQADVWMQPWRADEFDSAEWLREGPDPFWTPTTAWNPRAFSATSRQGHTVLGKLSSIPRLKWEFWNFPLLPQIRMPIHKRSRLANVWAVLVCILGDAKKEPHEDAFTYIASASYPYH